MHENEVIFKPMGLAMADELTPCLIGLKSTKKFLSSLGRFGNTPFLHSMYGSGELPQAFCRLCAVFGGTYYLGKSIDGIILNENTVKGIITNGQRISCKNFVIGVGNCPQKIRDVVNIRSNEVVLNRKMCLLSGSILPSEREQLTFASIPNEQNEPSSSSVPTYVQEAGFGPSVCPKGMYVLHMTTRQMTDAPISDKIDANIVVSDRETLLWSVDYKIKSKHIDASDGNANISNINFCNGPYFELDYDSTIEHAKSICKQLYPEDTFLPRAPDPEEIIIGGECTNNVNADNSEIESSDTGVENQPSNEADTKEVTPEPEVNSEDLNI